MESNIFHIGNLTLIEGKNSDNGHKGNSSLGSKTYDKKKISYKGSGCKITRDIVEKFNNFIPYIGDTKYLIIIFGVIFLTIFILITILTKKNAIKKNNDVTRKQPNLDDIIDKRDIKVSDDNEFVDVLVAIEEEMTAIRELYVGGYISKGVYISETDRLYEKAKIFGV